jgi:hypothetical protein
MQLFRSFAWLFLATSALAQSEWLTVRSAECGYTVKFPQQPTFHSDAVPDYAGGFRYSEFTIEEDHLVLDVTCSEVRGTLTEARLDLAKGEASKTAHAQIVRERKSKGVRDLDVKGEETVGRIKMVAAGRHLIQVIALVDDPQNLTLANKFVESFRLTPAKRKGSHGTH